MKLLSKCSKTKVLINTPIVNNVEAYDLVAHPAYAVPFKASKKCKNAQRTRKDKGIVWFELIYGFTDNLICDVSATSIDVCLETLR